MDNLLKIKSSSEKYQEEKGNTHTHVHGIFFLRLSWLDLKIAVTESTAKENGTEILSLTRGFGVDLNFDS